MASAIKPGGIAARLLLSLRSQSLRGTSTPQRTVSFRNSCRTISGTTQNIDSESNTSTIPPFSAPSTSISSQSSSYSSAPLNLVQKASRPPHSPQYDPSRAPAAPPLQGTLEPPRLNQNLRDNLPLLATQAPHYATIHIHGKPYLVTEGDVVRLPFLMHGVAPGDVLRINRVTVIGSREWTLQGGTLTANHKPDAQITGDALPAMPTDSSLIVGKTEGLEGTLVEQNPEVGRTAGLHKTGPSAFVDERLYTIRAVVTGTESEPLRRKEKKKQRNRHLRTIQSKHRYTMLRIKELHVSDRSL